MIIYRVQVDSSTLPMASEKGAMYYKDEESALDRMTQQLRSLEVRLLNRVGLDTYIKLVPEGKVVAKGVLLQDGKVLVQMSVRLVEVHESARSEE